MQRCAESVLRFWRVPVQIPGEVPEVSGADMQMRLRRVPVQVLGEVPESSDAATW